MFINTPFLLSIIICCSISCSSNITDNYVLYQNAIADAIYAEESEIDTNLVDINDKNPKLSWEIIYGKKHILVVAWKQNIDYYKDALDTIYNTGNYQIWVTTSPELKERLSSEQVSDTTMRIKQLLGLPPNTDYKYFVEFWVKPEDLFRPSPDKEITDKRGETCFPKDTDQDHINWINANRISRYHNCELYKQYPWTQLGYTFDWSPNNESHIGLSEFVIEKNKDIIVNKIYTTNEYLNAE